MQPDHIVERARRRPARDGRAHIQEGKTDRAGELGETLARFVVQFNGRTECWSIALRAEFVGSFSVTHVRRRSL